MRFAIALFVICASNLALAQKITRVTLSAAAVSGGGTITGTLELSDKVVQQPLVVKLTSSSTAATVPASVTLAPGQATATFQVTTAPVAADTPTVIRASTGTSSLTANLIVQLPHLTELTFSPFSVQGGSIANVLVKLNAPAPPGGVKVMLAANSIYWGGPPSVDIPAGASSYAFSVTTKPVVGITDVGVTASLKGSRASGSLDITPAMFRTFDITPKTVIGGASAIGMLTLDGPAPKDGFRVRISSDSPVVVAPSTVRLPAGTNQISFTITTRPVKKETVVRISAGGSGAFVELAITIEPAFVTGGG